MAIAQAGAPSEAFLGRMPPQQLDLQQEQQQRELAARGILQIMNAVLGNQQRTGACYQQRLTALPGAYSF
jgi:hypothetical protein